MLLDTRHDHVDDDYNEEDGVAYAKHNVQHLHLVRVIIEVCVLLIADVRFILARAVCGRILRQCLQNILPVIVHNSNLI